MAEDRQQAKVPATNNIIREAEDMSRSPQVSFGREDSNESPDLPPHERDSITRVPVTPGIMPSTYTRSSTDSAKNASPSYFTKDPNMQNNAISDAPRRESPAEISSPSNVAQGATSHMEVLRRMSVSLRGRRESISEIRAAAPDLALSGNIISVTFTTPHSMKYHKGGDWVSTVWRPG